MSKKTNIVKTILDTHLKLQLDGILVFLLSFNRPPSWQKGKDLTWYTKNNDEKEAARAAELKAIKEAEEEAMLEALGYPVKKKTNTSMIDAKELNNILQKGSQLADESKNEDLEIRGLGFKDSASKSLTGKVEATKFTSDISFSTGMPTVSPNKKVSSEKVNQQPGENDSDDSNSHRKHKDKKHKKSKSKSKSKKRRHDSDDERKAKKHSSRSKPSESKSRHSKNEPTRHSRETFDDREASRNQQHSQRRDYSPSRRAHRDDPTPRRSRSPRREGYSSRNRSRY
ncbi:hypothetical protein DSO57_1002354 [Entomophthora muscae]|uniref:Uncharacterized protein n=1 Tax=Entomophthora muscae TaxID=34485 RepID=A0ACC2UTM0_9FUNG|nr:hypothetical protein DSO57_1002354 [Entomophthora muscae]